MRGHDALDGAVGIELQTVDANLAVRARALKK